ncbi:hypothetical protein D1007_28075 [Hordeum vulgare]|nr:hypothetical protein D1007_28075 [Hordeum vulgare]
MTEQQAILNSIRDEAKVEANRWLIQQRHAEVDVLFDEVETEIEAEEAVTEQLEGAEQRQVAIYPSKGMEIVDILMRSR